MFQITAIPAFSDNYIWCLHDANNNALVVDPGCAQSVENFLHEHSLKLVAILITHHHPDHIGGVKQLIRKHQPVVYGFEGANFDFLDHALADGQHFSVLGIEFTVIEVPGHTLDHIAFYAEIPITTTNTNLDRQEASLAVPCLFCGDTLFSAGCGRLFEGSHEQMYASLDRLAKLPASTRIYCAHEYTLNNLKFAYSLMPQNEDLQQYLSECQAKRNENLPTIPSTLATELAINPFLRCQDPELIQSLKAIKPLKDATPVEVFRTLRKAKDNF